MLSEDSSSAVAPPVPPSFCPKSRRIQVPRRTRFLGMPNCGDFWFESNQEGSDWMLEKVQYLYGVTHDRAFLSHECEACTGVYWEVCHEEINTTPVPFTKSTPQGCLGEEKHCGEILKVTKRGRIGCWKRCSTCMGFPMTELS